MDRVLLFRPLSRTLLRSEVPYMTGSSASTLNAPGDISFTLPPEWAEMVAEDGAKLFLERGTLVVVERQNRTIRSVGLVDDLTLSADALTVSAGGLSMLPGQSGPWEGHQGYYVTTDPLVLFRRIWEQTQSYENSNLGVRVVGDQRTGSYVGDEGSVRFQNARRELNQVKPQLDKAEAHLLEAERVLSSRVERVFRAAYLKRVGTISQQENAPDDPGYKADSTIWVNNAWRAHRWRDGRWVSQSQADDAVHAWRNAVATKERAQARVEPLRYRVEPLQELVDEYQEREGREEYSLYYWQNHDMGSVIEDLVELGPFEFREEAAWNGEALDLRIRVGAPTVGVRREELHLELGVNVHEQPEITAPGDSFTGVALFGAGEGSEILSAQEDWNPAHMVRRILTETDKDAYTKQLTRAAANKLARETRADMKAGFTDLVIHHGKPCPEGSFDVGDILPVTGAFPDGSKQTQWVRVLDASYEWGSNKTSVEVALV